MPSLKYRSRTEIAKSILAVANGGATKIKIMYGADLTYTIFSEYLGMVLNNGLLEYVETERIYRTTSKGKQFLVSKNDQSSLIPHIPKDELANKVSGVLQDNKDGLTATQIALLTGLNVRGDLLNNLKKTGMIKTKKGISAKGRPTLLYVLNKNNPGS